MLGIEHDSRRALWLAAKCNRQFDFEFESNSHDHNETMRWLLSFLFLGLLSVVQALSSSGNRLLVVLEELAEKSKYSKYLGDLEGELHLPSRCLVIGIGTGIGLHGWMAVCTEC